MFVARWLAVEQHVAEVTAEEVVVDWGAAVVVDDGVGALGSGVVGVNADGGLLLGLEQVFQRMVLQQFYRRWRRPVFINHSTNLLSLSLINSSQ